MSTETESTYQPGLLPELSLVKDNDKLSTKSAELSKSKWEIWPFFVQSFSAPLMHRLPPKASDPDPGGFLPKKHAGDGESFFHILNLSRHRDRTAFPPTAAPGYHPTKAFGPSAAAKTQYAA